MAPDPSKLETDGDDASIIAAQEVFLTSGSLPAAKVLRSSEQLRGSSKDNGNDEESREPHRPQWYQQMKGVRFHLDDLDQEDLEDTKNINDRKDDHVATHSALGSSVMGNIVERETSMAKPVFVARGPRQPMKGFPAPRRIGRPPFGSAVSSPAVSVPAQEAGQFSQPEGAALMEEIDRENRKKLAEMSDEEILELQRSLQKSLPMALQEKLGRKSNSTLSTGMEDSSSGLPDVSTEVPGSSANNNKSRISPSSSSLPIPGHSDDDQSFDAHLRSFFPHITTSVAQPEWTLPVHPAEEAFYSTPDNSSPQANVMRFDFNGDFIPSGISRGLPTHLGLHHHSLDPGAAGYTLSELAILARSVQPSQKCIALKIIGFVLADVVRGKYTWDISEGLWDEIDRERIIEILLEVAKGGRESGGNRSVQRYAEDAVTRWVDVGGPKAWEERLKRKGYEKVDV
jgi:RNA polymerase II-associated protein 1